MHLKISIKLKLSHCNETLLIKNKNKLMTALMIKVIYFP